MDSLPTGRQRLEANAFGIGKVSADHGVTTVNQRQNTVAISTGFLLANNDKIAVFNPVFLERVVADFYTGMITGSKHIHEVDDFAFLRRLQGIA